MSGFGGLGAGLDVVLLDGLDVSSVAVVVAGGGEKCHPCQQTGEEECALHG